MLSRDTTGASWEKRGNTTWVGCERCETWFPVSVAMLRPESPRCCCPKCHHLFRPVAPTG